MSQLSYLWSGSFSWFRQGRRDFHFCTPNPTVFFFFFGSLFFWGLLNFSPSSDIVFAWQVIHGRVNTLDRLLRKMLSLVGEVPKKVDALVDKLSMEDCTLLIGFWERCFLWWSVLLHSLWGQRKTWVISFGSIHLLMQLELLFWCVRLQLVCV